MEPAPGEQVVGGSLTIARPGGGVNEKRQSTLLANLVYYVAIFTIFINTFRGVADLCFSLLFVSINFVINSCFSSWNCKVIYIDTFSQMQSFSAFIIYVYLFSFR